MLCAHGLYHAAGSGQLVCSGDGSSTQVVLNLRKRTHYSNQNFEEREESRAAFSAIHGADKWLDAEPPPVNALEPEPLALEGCF